MASSAILEVREGKLLESLRAFFRELLERKLVDALLIPLELPSRASVVQTLITQSGKLQRADPLAPAMPVSSAKIVSAMTRIASSQRKVGVVLRSCELRALVELTKLKQASLENLVLIGIDCFGTYSLTHYGEFSRKAISPGEDFLRQVRSGDETNIRKACSICEYPAPLKADIVVGLIGVDLDKAILLQATSSEGERILGALDLKDGAAEVGKREAALSQLIARNIAGRDEFFEKARGEVAGLENLLSTFAPCINCHNCRVACPICYCKECLLDSPTFEWEAEKYLERAEKRGALRMPTDTLLFHLTRLNHMVISCVGCGLCQEACPTSIPVSTIFRLVGARVQGVFDYVPGRSLEEELPLAVFKEDELNEVGAK